jgi:hypothetical protein
VNNFNHLVGARWPASDKARSLHELRPALRRANSAFEEYSPAVKGSSHRFKYRLALIVDGECVLRYDNEAGKGDHRHVGTVETSYAFVTFDRLLADFWTDVDAWRARHEDRNA